MRKYIGISLMLAAVAPSFAAGGADGTRGGGEVVITDGAPRLRDLVDPSTCEYKTGAEMRLANPELDRILSQIARLDWYFVAGLKWEIDNLQICLTQQLIRLPKRDWDSVIAYRPGQTEQIAIRFLNSRDVYLNRDLYDRMTSHPKDQAFLLIHEAIHSFIPRHAPRRSESVRSAVKTLSLVTSGGITNVHQMRNHLDNASVSYPWTARELSPHRGAVEFALNPLAEQVKAVLESKNVNTLFSLEVNPGLVYGPHFGALFRDRVSMAADLMTYGESRFQILDRLLNPISDKDRLQSFDPLLVAFHVASQTGDAEIWNRILNTQAMKEGPSLFTKMKDKDLVIKGQRIAGVNGYRLLGICVPKECDFEQGTNWVPALSLRPYSKKEDRCASIEVQGLIEFLSRQAASGEAGWAVVRTLLTRNDSFYEAFGVQKLLAKLPTLNVPVARERAYVAALLPELVAGFREALLENVSHVAGPEAASRMDQEIDWRRLGLSSLN